jgi:hypothetical protein
LLASKGHRSVLFVDLGQYIGIADVIDIDGIEFRDGRPYEEPKGLKAPANIKTLSAFFGGFRLQEISADQIRAYQQMRRAKCGPFAINHEYSVLQQMLKRIGRWAEIAPNYEALALPKKKRGASIGT